MADNANIDETTVFGTIIGSEESLRGVPQTQNPNAPQDQTARSAAPQSIPLPEIPGYRLLSLLGRGGMGHVYLAIHLHLERQVALKVVAAGATASEETLRRFRAESRAVAAIRHPGVCQIFEAGQVGHVPFLAMEFIDGLTLMESLRKQLPTPRQAALHILAIAQAMEACHQTGILHRDLKPANVMLNREGLLKVMDFGLAKRLGEDEHRTRTGEIVGTPSYMAPEQASGVVKQFGPPCDVYSIGAILYELLTGRPPFYTPDVMQTIMLVLTTDPPRPRSLQPRVPVDLETICLKCLEKSPHRRYPTAAALAEDVQRFLENRPILARRTAVWERGWKWSRRHPVSTALLAAGTFAVIGAAIGTTFHVQRLQHELNRSGRLLSGGLEHGRWLVNEHIPGVAKLRGGSAQQAALVTKTLEHLSQLSQDAGDDRNLGEYIAQAYQRIAEVQSDPAFATDERIEQALTSYQRALASYRNLNRTDESHLRAHQAAILLSMSALSTYLGQQEKAQQQTDQAMDLLSQLPDKDQDLPALNLLRLSAETQHAEWAAATSPSGEAAQQYWKLLQKVRTLNAPALEVERRELLARLSLNLAVLITQSNDARKSPASTELPELSRTADDYFLTAIEHFDWLTRKNPRRGQQLAATLMQRGRWKEQMGQWEEANQALRRAIEQQKGLTKDIPESVILRQELLGALEQRFRICEHLRDSTSSLAVAEEHRQIAEDLYLSDPTKFRDALRQSHQLLSAAHRQWPRYDEAITHLVRAVELARGPAQVLGESEHPPVEDRRALANLLKQHAELLIEQDRAASTHPETGQTLERAISLLDESLAISQELEDVSVIEADAPYWNVVELKHRLEERLDRWKLQNREKIGSPLKSQQGESPFLPLSKD